MVKIFQTYNFAKQNTYSLNSEILTATLIDDKRIAVSSADHCIEIYDIEVKQNEDYNKQEQQQSGNIENSNNEGERLFMKQSLPTVGEVVNLMYCDAGKYLITLERENVSSPVRNIASSISCTSSSNTTVVSEHDSKMFVRIYANFWKFPCNIKLNDLPITIRIASMTTPKSSAKSIDAIELPLRSPPDIMQCCQTSGNIIVSSKERIYLYEYTQCVHESTQPRFKYIDFLPFKFFVNLNFIPLKLNLAENVIACMNNRYCVAFRVVDILANNVQCTAENSDGFIANTVINATNINPDIYDNGFSGERKYVHASANSANRGLSGSYDNVVLVSDSSGNSKISALGHFTHTHNSFESDSLDTTPNNGRINTKYNSTPIDFNLARMVNSACGREFEVHIKSQWDNMDNIDYNTGNSINGCSAINNVGGIFSNKSIDTQEITINPTRANEIKIKLVNEAKAMNVQRISGNEKIISAYNDDNTIQYDIRKMLQICMKTNETYLSTASSCSGGGNSSGGRIMDILRCMDLKALYQRHNGVIDEMDDPEYEMGNQQIPGIITTSKHINRRTLKSLKHQNCIAFALIVTSSVDGYLYLFCAKGKWYNENEKPLATYSFTAPVLYVHINDYVIYAITTESVETHTSRLGHKLFNNRYEYSTLAEQYPEESSPDVNDPITVLSLIPVTHVQCVCVNRHNLVLISNSNTNSHHNRNSLLENDNCNNLIKRKNENNEKRNIAARIIAEARAKHNLLRINNSTQQMTANINNEWTLYNFHIPEVEHIVDDLDALAETFRFTSPTQFYDLMQEAQVMLRLSISLEFEQLEPDRGMILHKKFIHNCHKLADFAIRSIRQEIYIQATGFYKMCNLQLSDIYANYIKSNNIVTHTDTNKSEDQESQQHQVEKQQLSGLIYCIKEFLSNLGTQRLKSSFLHQSVTPYFAPKHAIKRGYYQVPLALEFLHLFIQYSPKDLPQILLDSPTVADCISGEIINYLKSLETLTPEENLLFAVTSCRMSNYMLSHEIVNRTSRYNLAVALIKYKNVLFDDSTQLFQGHCKRVSSKSYNMDLDNLSKNNTHKQDNPFLGGNNDLSSSHCVARDVTSFSDFTETILLAIDNDNLIEAISDVFIHAVCIEHTLTLDIVLLLFLNFIASHIGQKGYQTSQIVFLNILQVYYYDYFDTNRLEGAADTASHSTPQINENGTNFYGDANIISKPNSIRHDNESSAHSNSDSLSASSLSAITNNLDGDESLIRNNRILYDQLQEQYSPNKRPSNVPLNHTLSDLNIGSTVGSIPNTIAGVEECINNDNHRRGLKILFRMYMGRLKILSDLNNDLQSADIEQQSLSEDFISLRMECINFMMHQLQEKRTIQQQQSQLYYSKGKTTSTAPGIATTTMTNQKSVIVPYLPDYKIQDNELFEKYIKSYKRPIPCLMERPQYLNRLPPFQRNDFTYPNTDEGDTTVHFVGWQNELLTLTLKIQSLLASSKIDREIIEEFIAFIQQASNLVGIDSFLIIILPKPLAINYMINFYPECLWHYGKSNAFTPKQWESLLRKLINKRNVLPNWNQHITEILNNLVIDLSYEELLQCFPNEVIKSHNATIWTKELVDESHKTLASYGQGITEKIITNSENEDNQKKYKSILLRNHLPMDNIDEYNVFELTLRKAVSKQRSIALRSMIESTGKQLFDATNNPMYNL